MTTRPALTRPLAHSAAVDAGNRSMRAAGRTIWSHEDLQACTAEFYRLGRAAGWFDEDGNPLPAAEAGR